MIRVVGPSRADAALRSPLITFSDLKTVDAINACSLDQGLSIYRSLNSTSSTLPDFVFDYSLFFRDYDLVSMPDRKLDS